MFCTTDALNFIEYPKTLIAGNRTIFANHLPHFYGKKISFLANEFQAISIFKQTTKQNLTALQDIIDYFVIAEPVHYSLFAVASLVTVLTLVLTIIACYIKIPLFLVKVMCCCKPDCFVKKKALRRG